MFSIIALIACGNKIVSTKQASDSSLQKTINVSTATQLSDALSTAKPGDEIVMADGVYKGNFVIPNEANGTMSNAITLRGSRNAILDGATIYTGYVLHLKASYWILKGFSIRNGLKGLMTDEANHNVIDEISVNNIGEEGIHFRRFSSHNILQNAVVSNTGLKTPDYGEGVYIGTAVSNWAKSSNGVEDRSDSNMIINNSIGPNCTAECIDVKEGSTGGTIKGNKFNSTGITGANSGDSWMDVKGNNYLIESNEGFNPQGSVLKDGFQVHCAVNGWGNNNVFKNNKCEVNASGYGINITLSSSKGKAIGNKVFSDNMVIGAQSGLTNIVGE